MRSPAGRLTLACATAAKADSFSSGQFIAYSENDWGSGSVAPSILVAGYNSVLALTDDPPVAGEPKR